MIKFSKKQIDETRVNYNQKVEALSVSKIVL